MSQTRLLCNGCGMPQVYCKCETKTSKDWKNELYPTVTILDPDGWDRTNLEWSYNEELVTQDEFKKRFMRSTIYE